MHNRGWIKRIEAAATNEDLDRATAGYREQAIGEHSALRRNEAFNRSMTAGQFFRALEQVRRVRESDGAGYDDVIRVLESAARRELEIKMS